MRRIAALLLLAAALSACSSGAGNKVVPTAGQPASTTSAAPSSGKAKTFSECMQNHGVEVAEPDPGKGLTGIDPALAETPAFKTALEACKDLLHGGVRDTTETVDLQKYLAFAKCMRENGLPDFPDPKSGSNNGLFGGGAIDRSSPTFQKASKTCNPILEGTAG